MTMTKLKWIGITLAVLVGILLLVIIGFKIVKYASVALVSAIIGAGLMYVFMNKKVKTLEDSVSNSLEIADETRYS